MAILQLPNHSVKHRLIHAYNQRVPKNDYVAETIPTYFDTLRDSDQYGLLYDRYGCTALLFEKIPLQDVIDWPVDIRPFEHNTGQITETELCDHEGRLINDDRFQSYRITRRAAHLPNYTYQTIKKYITFIRLVGLAELGLDDVNLGDLPQKLIITVSTAHPIYTGKIEVTTW